MVSVIVLGYQQYEGIEDTLQTIIEQDYSPIEIIVSDDGSSDFPEQEIAEFIREKNTLGRDVRIRRNRKNLGLTAHANLAAGEARGEWIKFLSPGDGFCRKDALTRLTGLVVREHSLAAMAPALVCFDSFLDVRYEFPSWRRTRLLQSRTPKTLFSTIAGSNIIAAAGVIYARAFFDNGGFDEKYRNLDDWPTWLSMYREGRTIPCLSEPCVYYRIQGGTSSSYSNAFQSPVLRDDLVLCIEKEILPWEGELSPVDRWVVRYHLQQLKNRKPWADGLLFFPLRVYFRLKRDIKAFVLRGSV